MNRRLFFGTILGAVVGSRLRPEVPHFTTGGVANFGSGTMAMLSGREAVIPLVKVRLYPDASNRNRCYEGVMDECHVHRTSFRLREHRS